MNETRIVTDHHYYVPLTDEEHKQVKQMALDAGLTIKRWVQGCILTQLAKQNKKEE